MDVKDRIRMALKSENGIRLNAVEVRRIANALGIERGFRHLAKQSSRKAVERESKSPVNVDIRWMVNRDIAAVIDMDNEAVDQGLSEEEFNTYLRQRHTIGMVAERDGAILGFMIYQLHQYAILITRLIVRRDMRRRSVGKQMIGKLVGKLSNQRRNKIRIDVPEKSTAALMFLRSQSFVATAIHSDVEDLIVMEYDVNGRQTFQGRSDANVAAESLWQQANDDDIDVKVDDEW